MHHQISLFHTVYDCNMRKTEIFKRHQCGEILTKENLEFVLQTIEMMMALEMHVTTEIDFAIHDFIENGWEIDQKYVDYVIKDNHASATWFLCNQRYSPSRR